MKIHLYLFLTILAIAIIISLVALSSCNNNVPDNNGSSATNESHQKSDASQQRAKSAANTANQIDKFTEQSFLDQAVYDMMVDAGIFELDDPGDGLYRGISTISDLQWVTIDDGMYNLGEYFDPGYENLYHTYDIQILGSVYIAAGSP